MLYEIWGSDHIGNGEFSPEVFRECVDTLEEAVKAVAQ